MNSLVYGTPSVALVDIPAEAVQVSPLMPGGAVLEDVSPGTVDEIVIYAPRGTIERRYVMALAMRALTSGGRMTVLAANDRGGTRIKKELQAFGGSPTVQSRAHHRIATLDRPAQPIGLEAAVEAGDARQLPKSGLWSQPGVFAWDKHDPGSELLGRVLLEHVKHLAGHGADLGCGIGILSRTLLASKTVKSLKLVDLDRRAVEVAKRNVDDPRAQFIWGDARQLETAPLDFVAMNPPFHDGGREDIQLGLQFIAKAAAVLKRNGMCYLVANRHLPYEAALKEHFTENELLADEAGFKVYRAKK